MNQIDQGIEDVELYDIKEALLGMQPKFTIDFNSIVI